MRKPLVAAAAILASTLLLLGTIYLIRAGIMSSRERSAFRFAYRDAVYAVDQGRDAEAAAELRAAAEHATSPADWLSVLKQVRRLREPSLYQDLLNTAHTAFPKSEALAAARGAVLLEAGNAEEAWRVVSEAVSPEAYPALYSAILLSAEADPRDLSSDQVTLFASLPERDTPEPFLEAYRYTRAVPFLENALLLQLRDGNWREASETIALFDEASSPEELPQESAQLLLMATHTVEDRAGFYRYLDALGGRAGTEPSALMLQADLRMSARELDEARRLYQEVRTVAPHASPIPYLNGAYLSRRSGETAVELLRQAADRYPEDRRVQDALLRELVYQELHEEAEAYIATLEPYLTPKLLGLAFYRAPDLDRGYTARLWQLLNDEGNPPQAARLLAYHLVGINDLSELRRLLDRFPAEDHPWARFYLGYLAFRRGDYLRADQLFSDVPGSMEYPVPGWIWQGNRALAALYTGSSRRAAEAARRARDLLVAEPGGEGSPSHGTLLSIEAEALRLGGNRAEALQVARRAVSLAPNSNSARLVLRNLERDL